MNFCLDFPVERAQGQCMRGSLLVDFLFVRGKRRVNSK